MSEKRKEIIAGAVILLCFAAGLYYAHMRSVLRDAEEGYAVTATFGRIDGLSRDAEVRLSGVEVGRVAKQDFRNDRRPILTLRIKNGIVLPSDSSASIQTDGLFGGKYIVIEPGGQIETISPGGEITYTEDSMIVTDLLRRVISQGHAVRKERDEEITRLRTMIKAAGSVLEGELSP